VSGELRKLLPLYLVVFVGFLGYSLMITVFTPMMLQNDNGMLAESSTTRIARWSSACCSASIRWGSSWAPR